ncbi:MAG: PAS domain-containing sensor histidine kinase [Propionibacteriaceae bacterium]|jgi:two-component sensor histidine kinase/PAS domain-containing protein|nr:PAS domain-containing sensor histidine kinase [Propionibacteriaceae bacterium]
MRSISEVVFEKTSLSADDAAWLERLVGEWTILADLAFADLILWVPDRDDNIFWAVAQIRPNTGPTSLEDDVVGEEIVYDPEHLVTEAYLSHEPAHTSGSKLHAGIPVEGRAIPVMDDERCIAVVELHANRMGTRAPGALEDTYLETAELLEKMVALRQFPAPGDKPVPWVSPRVGDGIIRTDANGQATYVSPNALSAFRRLGLTGDLEGEGFIEVVLPLLRGSSEPVERTLRTMLRGKDTQEVDLESDTATLRLRVYKLMDGDNPAGALVMCRDTTELRDRERQLVTKNATIREIHHRVKNNLQTVAALLRLQARRIESPEAKEALEDAMKRVSSIAVVHKILSQAFEATVLFDDVADQLFKLVGNVATAGGKVRLIREGTFGAVSADVATNLALVLTELIQNAVEHGLGKGSGEVLVRPQRREHALRVSVINAGEPLPEGFSLESSTSLGLSIVKTLVDDMDGEFTISTGPDGVGTVATVVILLD